MSDSAFDDLLRTPLSSGSKENLLRKALAKSHSNAHSNNTSAIGGLGTGSSVGTTMIVGPAITTSDDEVDVMFKKPSSVSANESVAKSYILHAVENKLFNLADVNSAAELIKSRDLKNAEIARKTVVTGEKITEDDVDALSRRCEEFELSGGGNGDVGVNDENVLTKPPADTFAWHSTPHQEKANKPLPRRSFIQQPTPILLNRYLKHKQNQAVEMNTMLSRHLDAYGFDGETNGDDDAGEEETVLVERNQMCVSYVKYECKDSDRLPRIDDSPKGLCSSFSKSDEVLNSSSRELNSTYIVDEEDNTSSSSSESNLSSMSHKLTLSIQEVQKMADMQERSKYRRRSSLPVDMRAIEENSLHSVLMRDSLVQDHNIL